MTFAADSWPVLAPTEMFHQMVFLAALAGALVTFSLGAFVAHQLGR